MSDAPPNDVTRVLEAAAAGDRKATAELLPLVYEELRRLARSRMAHRAPGQTLQATALVHEAYLRVLNGREPESGWEGRRHFFFAAARAMRDILVEAARAKAAHKRGGDAQRVELEDLGIALETPEDDVFAVDEAVKQLEVEHPETAKVVMLRYFNGFTNEEVADVLDISLTTVERRWRFAKAWFRRTLTNDE